MSRVALGLGGNLGDVPASLRIAVNMLADSPGLAVAAVSSLYRTAPVGGPPQPDYLNAVVVADADAEGGDLPRLARDLLERAHEVEQRLRRTREVRWGPRTMDVDILAVGDLVLETIDLTIPHPRAHSRGFVLLPWAEADPAFAIPGHGLVAEVAAGLPAAVSDSVERLPGADWWRASGGPRP
jgi:2-amino-4-hydroxy-6-hydroxymethyldihydropteridine diphosphokinase